MRVLVCGSTGFLGTALVAELRARGHRVTGAARAPARDGDLAADLAREGEARRLVQAAEPDACVNLAAVPDIAPCRADPDLARRVNARAPGELAAACAVRGVRLLQVSTDQVFDGARAGWREEDEAVPRHEYGRSKLAGEAAALAACATALVVRPGLVTGRAPAGRRSASTALLEALARGARPRLFTDEWRSPVAVADVALALAALLELDVAWRGGPLPGAPGRVLHLGGPERLSRLELGRREAAAAGLDPGLCGASTRAEAGLEAERPADLSLDSARLVALLGWTPRTLAG